MEEFIALRDCVIAGHPPPLRHGDRLTLSARAAKYPLIRGWIERAPAAEETEEAPAGRTRRKKG